MALEHLDPVNPDPRLIERAANLLRAGRLVAFPTETVYGLGANALSTEAVQRIYSAKGRPAYNPLIVHVAWPEEIAVVAQTIGEQALRLAEAFWPGPLTLVLPKRPEVPDAVTAGLPTVAVRVPKHPVAHALLAAAGIPVAAPSANRSTQVSPTSGAHVFKSLGDAVDLILDAGPTPVGIESTVIDMSGDTPVLLRPGTISIRELEAIVGPIALPNDQAGEAPRRSPGMLDKHYAPRARVPVVDGSDVGIRMEHERANVQRVGAIVIHAEVESAPSVIHMPNDALGYAARLYDALHKLDDASCDVIVIERVPDDPAWAGVADRIKRAAFSD
jgi:L-threonylcarbamoyladenylate synthase